MFIKRILQRFNPLRHAHRSEMFHELLSGARRVSNEEYALNFGGIADDVVEMLSSEYVQRAIQAARETMERRAADPRLPPLQRIEFGTVKDAPELENGEVAAIDGTFALPMQKYSAGQAICVAIGSLSHRRPMQDTLHYWSSKVLLSNATDTADFLARENRGLFGIQPTAYLRYYEIKHCLDINEPYLFLDGPLIDKHLIVSPEGAQVYNMLFEGRKYYPMGVIKNIATPTFTKFARALHPGEIYVVETLEMYLKRSGQSRRHYLHKHMARDIFRGLFKPRNKAFGFEVHKEHLADMLRIMAADCQMNNPGREVPFLINRVGEEIRAHFDQSVLKERIAVKMAVQDEELFFQEGPDPSFRSND